MSGSLKGVKGIEEPFGGRQRDFVNEILRRGDSTAIEGGDPARERVDEAIQLKTSIGSVVHSCRLETKRAWRNRQTQRT